MVVLPEMVLKVGFIPLSHPFLAFSDLSHPRVVKTLWVRELPELCLKKW